MNSERKAISFNSPLLLDSEIKEILGMPRWADLPEIYVFSKETLEKLLKAQFIKARIDNSADEIDGRYSDKGVQHE